MVRILFWISLGITAYTYFGYAIWLWVEARISPCDVARGLFEPHVSIVMAVRNEQHALPKKLENLYLLSYPKEKLQIIVVSDGSSDRTAAILEEHGDLVVPVILPASVGKACALNEAVKKATGSVVILLDARQKVELNIVSEIASCFADPEVGAVSGELLLEDASSGSSSDALGIYWKLEKAIRKLESASGSVVGVTGAIYGIRRELFAEMPAGTILDDVFIPMHVALGGKRVVFQPSAIARDVIFSDKGKEFSRKVRTLTGNYQLLQLAPWLLSVKNPLLFRFISHKLLRLLVPLLLVLMLAASAFAGGTFFHVVFWLQMLVYGMALLGSMRPSTKHFKPVGIACTFVVLNAAATVAFYNFLAGRNKVWN